jgi:hypothetical protein
MKPMHFHSGIGDREWGSGIGDRKGMVWEARCRTPIPYIPYARSPIPLLYPLTPSGAIR